MTRRMFTSFLSVTGAIMLAAVLAIGGSPCFAAQPLDPAEKRMALNDSRKTLNTISTALSEIAATVSPAVVNVATTKNVQRQQQPGMEDLYNHPFFRRFFESPYSPEERRENYQTSSLGSGVIVSANGHILTNNHVIEDATEIVITLHDKSTRKAELIGADPQTDMALLKIDGYNLPTLTLDSENELKVGEIVVAVGIPFGLSHTVTMGIVSAVGRSNIGIVDYEDFIQTDAAINPGNSGGALVNGAGELVGINTAIFSTSGGNMGVGFAIPARMAQSVMDSLLEHGKVVRGYLGVGIQPITPELAESFNLEDKAGALISEVVDGSPADEAGLQQGDVVISFDGRKILIPTDLKNEAAGTPPGTTATITVIRDTDRKTLEVTLGELPPQTGRDGDASSTTAPKSFYGAQLQDLTPLLRRELDIDESVNGVLVVQVERDSPAAEVLQQNDIITQANRKNVDSRGDLLRIMNATGKDESMLLLVNRKGRSIYLTLSP